MDYHFCAYDYLLIWQSFLQDLDEEILNLKKETLFCIISHKYSAPSMIHIQFTKHLVLYVYEF